MKKKGLALILISALTMGTLVSCGGGSGSTGSSGDTPKENDSPKIGATIYSFEDNFMSYQRRNIEKLCNGKAELLMNDSQNNQSKQIEQVDTMIAKGVDILAINLVDPKSAPTVVDKAKADNLPVVFFNKEPDEAVMQSYDKVWYVGTTSEESGIIQGEVMAEGWKANPAWDKNGDGKIQYVMLKGEPGHPDAEARTKYSIETINKAGIETEELAMDTAMWDSTKATEKMDAWIAKNGDNIEMVICNNDGMALGAISSLEKAGYLDGTPEKFIPIYGVDAIPEALDKIKAGKMAGTVLNDAKNQAQALVDSCMNLVNGKEITEGTNWKLDDKKSIRVPYVGITKDNINVAEDSYK
ncbi:galactose/glucose ABC transporter substrate-binding protein MglB [Clostridium perfringens]|uniref:galactose/glucose ABC transporter substrate-binding protein MglB n=1 Tax=Clostridium perfringens TaxID=1502 RepID=UPI0018A92C10|nr:galactose/glucose ABC transporter substrate-binding protein MglB [Clostridium perfringens]